MGWDSTPPKPEELGPKWDATPPTADELKPKWDLALTPTPLDSFLAGSSNLFNVKPFVKAVVQEPRGALKELADSEVIKMSHIGNLLSKIGAGSDEDKKHFEQARTNANKSEDTSYEANPSMYNLGRLPAGLIESLLTPATKTAAGAGALAGMLPALGDSLSSGQDLMHTTANMGLSGLTGAGVGYGLGKVTSFLSPENLDKIAKEQAVKSVGRNRSGMERTVSQDRVLGRAADPQNGVKAVGSMGDDLLKPNPYSKNPITTFGSSAEDRLEVAKEVKLGAGKNIAKTLNLFDEQVDPEIRSNFLNPETIAAQVEKLKDAHIINGLPSHSNAPEIQKLDNLIADIKQYGSSPISFADAQHMKQLATSKAFNAKGEIVDEDIAKARGIINDAIETAANKVAGLMKDPSIAERYVQDKDLYRTALEAIHGSRGQYASDIMKKAIGFDDVASAGLGNMIAGHPGSIPAMLFSKYVNNPAKMATTANALKPASENANKILSLSKEWLAKKGAELNSSTIPGTSKLGWLLTQLAEKDDVARNATLFQIMQIPTYRKIMNGITEDQDKK